MILHVSKSKPNSHVMVKANGTDVLILLLYHMQNFLNLKVWMTGTVEKKADHEYVDCIKLSEQLGPYLCNSLLGFHAFTGCDYTAAFYRRGKNRPFGLLEKNEAFHHLFSSLSELSDIHDTSKVEKLEEFTLLMYSVKKCSYVNAARSTIFHKIFSSKKDSEKLIKKIRGFDLSTIPPYFKSLKQNILRNIFVTRMWKHATEQSCITLDPKKCGWVMKEILEPFWFKGNPTPLSVDHILNVNGSESLEKETDNEEDDLDDSQDSSDSDSD